MSWKAIPLVIVAVILLLLAASFQAGRTKQTTLKVSATHAVGIEYQKLTQHVGKVETTLSPQQLREYFTTADKLSFPSFIKRTDIFLAETPVKMPSDEVVFAVQLHGTIYYAVNGSGQVQEVTRTAIDKWPHSPLEK